MIVSFFKNRNTILVLTFLVLFTIIYLDNKVSMNPSYEVKAWTDKRIYYWGDVIHLNGQIIYYGEMPIVITSHGPLFFFDIYHGVGKLPLSFYRPGLANQHFLTPGVPYEQTFLRDQGGSITDTYTEGPVNYLLPGRYRIDVWTEFWEGETIPHPEPLPSRVYAKPVWIEIVDFSKAR